MIEVIREIHSNLNEYQSLTTRNVFGDTGPLPVQVLVRTYDSFTRPEYEMIGHISKQDAQMLAKEKILNLDSCYEPELVFKTRRKNNGSK